MTKTTNSKIEPHVLEYMEMVESGRILACREQHKLMAYLRRVFETENLWWDEDQIEKYFTYQKYFPFDLYEWEKFCFVLHNCVFKEDGMPRWQDLLIYMGRGGGKNGYLSFEDFCLLTETHGVFQYHIDICANSEDQAKTSFQEIYDVLENPAFSKKFKRNFYWNQTVIRNLRTRSEIRYRTNNAKTKDGLRSGKVDFDEMHAYENWDNLNVFMTGLGKKPHPRMTYVTTDGDVREGPLDQMKERAEKILNGELEDNGLLPFMCKLDSPEEVHDERNWVKPNPSLAHKPELMQRIRTEYQNYLLDPVRNSAFMTKRMNVPQGHADVEVTSWENILKTNRELPDLTGRSCVCGIDFTKTTDFMSAVLLFRDGEEYYAMHHSWFCAKSRDRERIKIPLEEMQQRGLLTIVDDVEVNPMLITEWIQEMRRRYNITSIACDSYRYSLLSRALDAIGYTRDEVKMVRPSDIMQAQIKISSIFARGLIAWGDDPLMRWFTNNTKLEPAPNNNFKYGKIEGKSRKTDGFMAFVHAMTIEERIPDEHEIKFMEPIIF